MSNEAKARRTRSVKSCASSTGSALAARPADERDELGRNEAESAGESATDEAPRAAPADLAPGGELEVDVRRRLGSGASCRPASCCSHVYGMPYLLRTTESLKPPVLNMQCTSTCNLYTDSYSTLHDNTK